MTAENHEKWLCYQFQWRNIERISDLVFLNFSQYFQRFSEAVQQEASPSIVSHLKQTEFDL